MCSILCFWKLKQINKNRKGGGEIHSLVLNSWILKEYTFFVSMTTYSLRILFDMENYTLAFQDKYILH